MLDVNKITGKLNDSEIFDEAMQMCGSGGVIVITSRRQAVEPERDWWLIDRAILIPPNTTVVMVNCKIKLSDNCRDNFFRTDNCGLGIEDPAQSQNIHIKGIGTCILEGADHPRSTGDAGKTIANPCPYKDEDLIKYAPWISDEEKNEGVVTWDNRHNHSFGTDAGNDNESQYGDWRNVGILFANTIDFSIDNVKIVNSHGWGISLEACTYGTVKNIAFDATMHKEIDGMDSNTENQDGIDIRNGCNNITISNITGRTGDDIVALTAIADTNYKPGGSLCSTHVMHNDWNRRDPSIHDIIIRDIIGYSNLCFAVRMLPVGTKIYNIIVENVNCMSPIEGQQQGAFVLGGGWYGECLPKSLSNITISNIISNAQCVVNVAGYLKDSIITNVVNVNKDGDAFFVQCERGLDNVMISNINSYKILNEMM